METDIMSNTRFEFDYADTTIRLWAGKTEDGEPTIFVHIVEENTLYTATLSRREYAVELPQPIPVNDEMTDRIPLPSYHIYELFQENLMAG